MAEASNRHRDLIDAALRIYRPAMRQYITETLKRADDWYEEWLVEQKERSPLPKGVSPQYYEDKLHCVQTLKLDPYWLIEVGDFPDIIKARESNFPPEIQKLTGAMRKIAKGSKSRAPRQVGPILENCNTVLQEVGGDAAKQIQRLIETGEPNERRKAEVGTFHGSDTQEGITRVLELYRTAMQTYVSTALQSGHADRTGSYNWFQDLVFIDWPDGTRGIIKGRLSKGASHKELIEEAHFARVIRGNPEDFPEVLSDGTYDGLFNIARDARNDFVGHSAPSSPPLPPRVEEVASACVTILTLCRESPLGDKRLDDAMEMIRRIISGKGELQPSDSSPSPEIADDSPPAQGAGPVIEDAPGLALLRDDDRGKQDEEARRREMGTLSYQDPEAGSEMESVGREREKRPFFGGVLARFWASEAAQSGSSGGGGAFAADGEVDEREPVRGRRWIPVAGALLAVILVGIAIAFGFAVSDLWPRGDQIGLETESATAPSGEQARQQESSATEEQSATEGEGNGGGAPTPPADSGTESNGQGGGEPSSPESAQTPSGGAGEDEPSDSGDGGQAEAGSGEQPGTGGCTGDECPTESGQQQERAGQAPSGGAGGGGTSESDDDGQTGAGDGEQTGAGGCTGGECSTESGSQQERPTGTSSDASGGGTSDSGGGDQTGAGGGEGTAEADCVTNEEGECGSEAGDEQETQEVDCVTNERNECEPEAGGEQDGDSDTMEEDGDGGLEDDDDTMDDGDWDNSELEEGEPGTTIVTADDGYPIITVVDGDGAIDPESDTMDDDVTSHYSFDAEPEEIEPGVTIVNVPMGEPEDGLTEDIE